LKYSSTHGNLCMKGKGTTEHPPWKSHNDPLNGRKHFAADFSRLL
jgi:hypothetical protein